MNLPEAAAIIGLVVLAGIGLILRSPETDPARCIHPDLAGDPDKCGGCMGCRS